MNFTGEHEQEVTGESEIEVTPGAPASIKTAQGERAPQPVPSETRATRDAVRSRETTGQGATPSVPGETLKMFIILALLLCPILFYVLS